MNTKSAALFFLSALAAGPASTCAFSMNQPKTSTKAQFDPLMPSIETKGDLSPAFLPKVAAATATAAVLSSPLVAKAVEEVDGYEYGAVDAPIGLAWGAGVVVILTAAVPVFMQGGEEAFEEMRERDAGNWGSGNSDRLNGRR